MPTVGLDIGSLTTKVAVLGDGEVLSSVIVATDDDDREAGAREAVQSALAQAGLTFGEDICLVSTGVGGKAISFSRQQKAITTCLARGVHHLLPSARMAIDMGAESCTVIKLNPRGRVDDWTGHDKCAAGTGLFLQQMARLMQVPMEEMSALSGRATERAGITSTCAVFAESDVISHVHRDPPTPPEDLAAGIYYSVAGRIISMCKRIGVTREVAATGGVALSQGLISLLASEMRREILVPDEPQLRAAIGAAILAQESVDKGPAE